MRGANEVASSDDLENATRGVEVAAWKAVPEYVIVEPIAASPDSAVVVGPAAAALPAGRAALAAATAAVGPLRETILRRRRAVSRVATAMTPS